MFNGFQFSQEVTDKLFAGFAETDIYLTNNLAAKIGSRLEHSAIMSKWNIAPRVSIAYKLADNSQASFAYGIFYQSPERKLLPSVASVDYAKATHYILQYLKQTKDYTFRTEAFYKKYNDLVKTFPDTSNNGTGFAKGIEFFWRDKKTFKGVDYWISYSYLDNQGIIPTTSFTRNTFFGKFSNQITSNFNATISINYINSVNHRTQEGNGLTNPLWTIYAAPVTWNPEPETWADGTQRGGLNGEERDGEEEMSG